MTSKATQNILVLCTGNSCRSQIMQAYLQYFIKEEIEKTNSLNVDCQVYSAGIEKHGLNPNAVKVMDEDDINIAHHTSNHLDEYANVPFTWVITVCSHAREQCPHFENATTSRAKKVHRSFPDPANAEGSEVQIMNEFRKVRNMIKVFASDFVRHSLKL